MTLDDHRIDLEDAANPAELNWALASLTPAAEAELEEEITVALWRFDFIEYRI